MRALGKLSSRTIGVIGLSIVTGILLLWLQMEEIEPEPQHPVMGIVSTLAEDQRQDAQMAELIQTAEQDGFDVLPMPVERTQASQIEAIRALIVYQVDVIVFVPLVEDGWENVMHEADTAGIPAQPVPPCREKPRVRLPRLPMLRPRHHAPARYRRNGGQPPLMCPPDSAAGFVPIPQE